MAKYKNKSYRAEKFAYRQVVSGVQCPDDRKTEGDGLREWSPAAPEPRNPDAGWSVTITKGKHDQGEG